MMSLGIKQNQMNKIASRIENASQNFERRKQKATKHANKQAIEQTSRIN